MREVSNEGHPTPPLDPWTWKQWLIRALRNFAIRFGVLAGFLQGGNYVLGGDDAYEEWAARNRGVLLIALVLCLIVNMMYDWLWSRTK